MKNQGIIVKVSGPLVVAKGLAGTDMYELVRVGTLGLFGEVIEIRGERFSIQVYEETGGIGPGEPVVPTSAPLTVELGPGLVTSIFDGIQRPLDRLRVKFGDFVIRGAEAAPLDRTKKWHFIPLKKAGDKVVRGDIIGTIPETPIIEYRVMVPPGYEGTLREISEKEATLEEPVAMVNTSEGEKAITLLQKWPVRTPRPVKKRLIPCAPLVTGQRVLDTLFPIAKGGTACVPGPFGSGKTVVQHQLAKWADADLIVYVGCGERGNEMTDVLIEFPELIDPRSGRPLIERTILVANTSNMPVAAREASVFTGITMAEYYRDMGYSVALMADSTSRWAEAMREMSGRLEEMPGEEGYPAYLASRLASFYERAGRVICEGSDDREGSLSVIGAVSPPGGDLSEPVVQATLRVVKVFWGLDDKLAGQRHFPAINWLASYSLYQELVDRYCTEKIDQYWAKNRREAMAVLKREAELEELVRLVGMDALSIQDRLLLEAAKMIREDFLHQNAYDPVDTYTSFPKQFKLLQLILGFYHVSYQAITVGVELEDILKLPVRNEIPRAKFIPEGQIDKIEALRQRMKAAIDALKPSGENS
ncbi:MAG: V-type ATP synthase subunit A [Candidatus Aureabacteria bacterium]|nr:V-type ATP synthase subunit A [Candidatus Auribacterota bacterium]